MKGDFPDARVADVKILNIGTLGEEYAIRPSALSAKRNKGYFSLWGGGERLLLTTMAANQQLHKAMLERELRSANALDNYVLLDDTLPGEAACEITLDNASQGSLRSLASRGKQLATNEFTKNRLLRAFFDQPAASFKPSLLHSSRATLSP